MAVIGRIRRHGWLLLVIVGVAMLAFVLGDILTSGGNLFTGTGTDVGKIAGEPVPWQYYEQRFQQEIEAYKQQAGVTTLDQSTLDLFREQVWSQILNEIIMDREYEELALSVNPNEIIAIVTGQAPHQPHPSIIQAFTDPETGQFNPGDVIRFLKNKDYDQTGQAQAQWITFEKNIKSDQQYAKYNNLIRKGLYVTTAEARRDYETSNRYINIKYVVQPYSDIPDTAVKVTEKDLKKYHKNHSIEFEQEASRVIEYVVFDVYPTPQDTQDIYKWAEIIYNELAEVNGEEEIASFVNINSDTRYTDVFKKEGFLPEQIDSLMFNSDTGFMAGPFIEEGSYKVAKLVDIEYRPDSVKARHILIPFPQNVENPKDSAIAIADTLKKQLQQGSDFDLLANQFSSDRATKNKGGDLGWFAEGDMVKPFNDSCFSAKPGDMKIIESQFGVHLAEVTGIKNIVKKVKVAIIDRKIDPGKETFSDIYNKARVFALKAQDRESFYKAADENDLATRIADNIKEGDAVLAGLESPRDLVRWAYSEKKNAISPPYEFGTRYVIARLSEVMEKGVAPLGQVRNEIKAAVIKKKKADMMIEKIKSNDDRNIDDLAKNLNTSVETANDVIFSQLSIPGIGREAVVLGKICALQKGILSEPIEGESGVFVVLVESSTEPPQRDNYVFEKIRLQRNIESRVEFEVFNALKGKANVKDMRHIFY